MSTQPLMKHEVVLPVIVDGYHWTCNQDRMWNLNELHKELGLPDEKKPYRWDNQVRTVLDQARNFVVAHGGSTPGQWRSSLKDKLVKDANLHVLAGRSGGTLATEEAAIAYAMWVSDDFYLKVIRAFIALRNDKVSEAKALAQESKELKGLKPIARNWLEKLDNPKQGHTLTECLKNLDFRLGTKLVSAKALNAVLKSGRIANPFYSRKLDGRGQPVFDISSGGWMTSFNPKGLENGYYRLQDNHYNGQEGLKVLTKGYEWLKSNKVELVRLCAKGGL
ncbi:KilA-N domain-containing protein [Escherichia coli]|nr:KilA-N domain-containing protein [Escherichia coli]